MKTPRSCLAMAACLIATCLSSAAAFGACEMPALVSSIPNGETATEAELLAAQADVEAYVAAMDDYIACSNEEMRAEAGAENAMDTYLYLMTARIEQARNEVDQVASDFNDQVAAFRAARQAPANLR